MYKLRLTGYELIPGAERILTRTEMGQLNRQNLPANRGVNWRIYANDDGAYCLRHASDSRGITHYALEIV